MILVTLFTALFFTLLVMSFMVVSMILEFKIAFTALLIGILCNLIYVELRPRYAPVIDEPRLYHLFALLTCISFIVVLISLIMGVWKS